MGMIAMFINVLVEALTLLVIAHVILSYFMDPYHPVRRFVDGIIDPLLAPVRRIMPATGPIDFSPLVVILGLQIVGTLLVNMLR